MKINIIIFVLALCIIAARSTILPISGGGTNAAAMLTNGKIAYSTLGSIVEALPLQSTDGNSITIGETYASITPVAPMKLNLIGMNNNNTGSPGIATYTSADNYPLIQILPFAHDDISINFDMYWDLVAQWRSSYSGSNFQIWKYSNTLQFNYASGVAQGSLIAPSTAFSIQGNGSVIFQRPIKLVSSGGTSSDLYYYSEATYTATLYRYDAYYGSMIRVPLTSYNSSGGYSTVYTTIRFVRINNIVTAQIDPFTMIYYKPLIGDPFPGTSIEAIVIDTNNIPSKFRPKYGSNFYSYWSPSVVNGPRTKTTMLTEGSIAGMGSVTIMGSIIASNTTSPSYSCGCYVTNSDFFIKPEGGYTFPFKDVTIGMKYPTTFTYEVDPAYA